MCRYINAEQISFSELFTISKSLDIKIRQKNNAVIRMSTNEIYDVINNYGTFFCIENDTIKLSYMAKERYNKDNDEFIDILDSYFCAGIPSDIKTTVLETVSTL